MRRTAKIVALLLVVVACDAGIVVVDKLVRKFVRDRGTGN